MGTNCASCDSRASCATKVFWMFKSITIIFSELAQNAQNPGVLFAPVDFAPPAIFPFQDIISISYLTDANSSVYSTKCASG